MQVILLCLPNRHRHFSYRANDDGEPSNSAGMPIYGQIVLFSYKHTRSSSPDFGEALNRRWRIDFRYKTTAQLTLESCELSKKR
jgi:hypothetical protein